MEKVGQLDGKFWQKKSVLITGAAGFIGSHLTRRLVDAGCDVSVLIRESSDVWRITDVLDRIRVIRTDLINIDIELLKEECKGTKILFHLGAAGISQEADEEILAQTNADSTLSLLKLAKALDVERFIYTGSCFEYNDGTNIIEDTDPYPMNEYSASKTEGWRSANMFHKEHDLPVISLRPFTAYGPFEAKYRMISYVINQILDGNDLELTESEQARDFIYIDDCIDAFLLAATMPDITGETFNLCTGEETKVKDLVLLLIELLESEIEPKFGKL